MGDEIRNLLTKEIAQEICDIFTEETGYPLIVADRDGIIFAATVRKRIGTFHSVAKQIMDGVLTEGVVTKEEEERMDGNVKAGINVPIVYKGMRLASVGIAGDPSLVRPLIGIAVRIMQLWLKNLEVLDYLTRSINQINGSLQEIAATVEEVTAGAEQVAAASQVTAQIANDSKEKVKDIEQVLKVIKHMAAQSNLIGLNAAIEAARVGEAGRGFSVVANEVRKLAATSAESVENIEEVINQIQDLFLLIANKVEENKEVTSEQSTALAMVSDRIQSIESTMSKIIENINQSA